MVLMVVVVVVVVVAAAVVVVVVAVVVVVVIVVVVAVVVVVTKRLPPHSSRTRLSKPLNASKCPQMDYRIQDATAQGKSTRVTKNCWQSQNLCFQTLWTLDERLSCR